MMSFICSELFIMKTLMVFRMQMLIFKAYFLSLGSTFREHSTLDSLSFSVSKNQFQSAVSIRKSFPGKITTKVTHSIE